MLFLWVKGLVKDGFTRVHQRLKCKVCGKRFVYNKRLCDSELYKEYLDGKQNVAQLAYTLTDKDKDCFMSDFNSWYEKHKSFISERSKPDKNGKTHYVHKRLRSAWLSLKRNMPYLWVWYDNKELGIPNTNNGKPQSIMKSHGATPRDSFLLFTHLSHKYF